MTPSRQQDIHLFLQQHHWHHAALLPLASDASFRHYSRLTYRNHSAILMDAPPEKEPLSPFILVADYLKNQRLNSPDIFACDEKKGLMLLEDFGNHSFTSMLQHTPSFETELSLYRAAIDVLLVLHQAPVLSNLPPYSHTVLVQECDLLPQWHLRHFKPDISPDVIDNYRAIWHRLLQNLQIDHSVTVLRDYHADNLMWLPHRQGVERVGLLDFQDALIGSPLYDIISLLEDIRRIVPDQVIDACNHYYLEKNPTINHTHYKNDYAILAAQRNCKILGIFCRLAQRDGKTGYLRYLPNIWRRLKHELQHPALKDLKHWFNTVFSEEDHQATAFPNNDTRQCL